MANVRVFLWVTLLAIVFVAYTEWVRDYPPAAPLPQYTPSLVTTTPTESSPPADVPSVEGASPSEQQPVAPRRPATTASSALVHVRTDVLDVSIDEHGDLVRADLLEYPVSKHAPDQVVRLLDYQPQDRFVFHTGIAGVAGAAAPNHVATFRAAAAEYVLAADRDDLVVTLEWVGEGPIHARKTYTFQRGEYSVGLALAADAPPGTSWRGRPYVRLERLHNPAKRSYTSVDSYSFTGPLLYDGNRYEKLKFDDLLEKPVEQTVVGGWLAAIQHHFVAAAVPPLTDTVAYTASATEKVLTPTVTERVFTLTATGSVTDVTSATPLDYHVKLFVGPKLQDQLAATGPELALTVDYGKILKPLSAPMFWVLSKIEIFVNNWGWAIVIMTVLIKLAFYKLTQVSGRSMAKMRKLAPRLKALQERYKDDRQALSQATFELYRKEKANPVWGCVPMLIQMPFFFAFYWVLIESVEMRQAPFMLWINDLSSRDPYFVLPLLMGVAMFFQTRLNPAPPDPVQARIMQIMPVVFTGFFLLFPAGLVLYWLTNTLLTMLQQWRINKVVEQESAPA